MSIKRILDAYVPIDPKAKPGFLDIAVIGFGLALVLVGGAFVASLLLRDARSAPRYAVDPNEWRILYHSEFQAECTRDLPVSATCLASPENPALWSSAMRRGSTEFSTTFKAKTGEPFWMDGVFQLNHQFITQGLPAQIQIPRSRLTCEVPHQLRGSSPPSPPID